MFDVAAYVALKDKIAEFNILLVQRVTKLEAVLENIGIKSARILHSPNDHLAIDFLLDKYLDRHYELSMAEWTELMRRCEAIENNREHPHGVRVAAAMLNAVCHHKLMLDPTTDRWWQQPGNKP